MFFRNPKPVACVVCGRTIAPKERRFVEKNRITKEERHTHIECRKPAQTADWQARTLHGPWALVLTLDDCQPCARARVEAEDRLSHIHE